MRVHAITALLSTSACRASASHVVHAPHGGRQPPSIEKSSSSKGFLMVSIVTERGRPSRFRATDSLDDDDDDAIDALLVSVMRTDLAAAASTRWVAAPAT
jgi:hypothetical protein